MRSEAERTGLLLVAFQVCSPANAMPPNAGMQFFKNYLSAQPAGDFWILSAGRDGGPFVLGELAREGSTHPRHFFFSTVHGAFSFWCFKKKMGGAFHQAKPDSLRTTPAFPVPHCGTPRTNPVRNLILINI